ncbi:MAG: ArsI/CadI family heavy metal resistance metalloenzyme [Pseudomonadota bacterium]
MRVQLALDVVDLEAAIDFYSKMFGVEPSKRKQGYANFAIEQPPLKLVLFETQDQARDGEINHLGVETTDAADVIEAEKRVVAAGLDTTGIDTTICCYAEKTETWLKSPDGNRWEWYVKHGDAEQIEYEAIS